jgi:hypothetical protein
MTSGTDGFAGTASSHRAAAAEFVDQPRFHRRMKLPATDAHGELAVTYAVAGAQSHAARTVLFIGGLMGSRYVATFVDYLAESYGLRIVVVDRSVHAFLILSVTACRHLIR